MAFHSHARSRKRLHTALILILTLQCPQATLANARIVEEAELPSSQLKNSPLSWLFRSSSIWQFGGTWYAGPALKPFEPAELSLIFEGDVDPDPHDRLEEPRSNSTSPGGSFISRPDAEDVDGDCRDGDNREISQDIRHVPNGPHTKQDESSSDGTPDASLTSGKLDDAPLEKSAQPAEYHNNAKIPVYLAPHKKQMQDSGLKPYQEHHQPGPVQTPAPNEKQKRQSNPCADEYSQCTQAGAPGLCCPTSAICSADKSGNVGCCPLGAACTGSIGMMATRTANAGATASAGGSAGGVVIGGGAAGDDDGGGASVTAAVVGGTQTTEGAQETGSAGGEVILGAGATSLRRDPLSMERWWGLGWVWSLGVAFGLTIMVL